VTRTLLRTPTDTALIESGGPGQCRTQGALSLGQMAEEMGLKDNLLHFNPLIQLI
jgi:hypothetical protein